MLEGPFSIEISETAEKVEVKSLSPDEKRLLLEGVAFDEEQHDIFRFFIAPIAREPSKYASRRQIKRVSYAMADRAYVDVSLEKDQDLVILGMHPRGYDEVRGYDLDIKGHASLALLQYSKLDLTLSSKLKNIFRKRDRPCWAFRVDKVAQWIFGRTWLREGREFRLQVVLLVPKSLEPAQRVITCAAKFADGGRALAKTKKLPVLLPT